VNLNLNREWNRKSKIEIANLNLNREWNRKSKIEIANLNLKREWNRKSKIENRKSKSKIGIENLNRNNKKNGGPVSRVLSNSHHLSKQPTPRHRTGRPNIAGILGLAGDRCLRQRPSPTVTVGSYPAFSPLPGSEDPGGYFLSSDP